VPDLLSEKEDNKDKKHKSIMRLVKYVKASYAELVHKVSWTPMKELQSLAVTVMVASLLIAVAVLAMDVTFESIMKAVYSVLA
jgi:preprotein translocase subunit SecE